MPQLGELVANGRTSRVYAFGPDSVVKVQRPGVPEHWSELEARFTSVVNALGIPSPEVRSTIDIDGRESIVFERVTGPSMWQLILERPEDTAGYASELAAIQTEIFRAALPAGIPDLIGRMCAKIQTASQLDAEDKDRACDLARSLPHGAALLHGDLHPGNVLMSRRGPVVIDWFDAAIGHPAADVVRTSLLVRPLGADAEHPYLPAGSAEILNRFLSHYRTEVHDILDFNDAVLPVWESVIAASRLAEDVGSEESELLELWRRRDPQ